MCSREIIKEINIIDQTPFTYHYFGVYSWHFPLKPKYVDKSTQTDDCKYFNLGMKVAKKYGDGWELLG